MTDTQDPSFAPATRMRAVSLESGDLALRALASRFS
jgi:hypothetical protein